ncbi:MAG: hypothetical protein ACJ76N_14430, partial [Thermoanaerobaculia bacterium]
MQGWRVEQIGASPLFRDEGELSDLPGIQMLAFGGAKDQGPLVFIMGKADLLGDAQEDRIGPLAPNQERGARPVCRQRKLTLKKDSAVLD